MSVHLHGRLGDRIATILRLYAVVKEPASSSSSGYAIDCDILLKRGSDIWPFSRPSFDILSQGVGEVNMFA